jgi:hypothetical protein
MTDADGAYGEGEWLQTGAVQFFATSRRRDGITDLKQQTRSRTVGSLPQEIIKSKAGQQHSALIGVHRLWRFHDRWPDGLV